MATSNLISGQIATRDFMSPNDTIQVSKKTLDDINIPQPFASSYNIPATKNFMDTDGSSFAPPSTSFAGLSSPNTSYNLPAPYTPGINTSIKSTTFSAMSANGAEVPSKFLHQSTETSLKIEFIPNILDFYDTYTYHFKLFIMDPESSAKGDILNTKKQLIIAESAVSDLYISDVTMSTIKAPSVEHGTYVSTEFTFTLTEAAGAKLIDNLYYQAIALGIGNWITMPVYLQLQFRDRTAPSINSTSTLSTTSINVDGLNQLLWTWVLSLSEMKATVTHEGTIYNCKAILYNDHVQSNINSVLQHPMVLENTKTIGEALKELQDNLNLDQSLRLLSNYSIPDEFRIIVDPEIAGYVIDSSSNTRSSRSDSVGTIDDKCATFSKGTSIDKIIDTLMLNTKEVQAELTSTDKESTNTTDKKPSSNNIKKFWRIITEARPIKFDVRRVNDAKLFVIYVIKYDIGVLYNPVDMSNPEVAKKEHEKNRLMRYIGNGILRKKYNYIFTGLNDQVTKFDLTLNNAFAVGVSRFSGIYKNYGMASKGKVTHNNAEEEAKVTEKIVAAMSFMSSASRANSASGQAAITDAQKAIDESALDDATKNRYAAILKNSKPDSRLSFHKELRSSGGLDNDGKYKANVYNARMLAQPVTDRLTGEQLTFITDIDTQSPEVTKAISEYNDFARSKLRPIPIAETNVDNSSGVGIESAENSKIQKTTSMFNVALHSSLDVSLVNIKLSIKGDPYWLSPPPSTSTEKLHIYNSLKPDQEAIDFLKNSHKKTPDYTNSTGSDVFILLRFKSPHINKLDLDPNASGKLTEIEVFSGIYKVISVMHNFTNGIFTQELSCLLDNEINITPYLKLIDDAEILSEKQYLK